MAKKITIPGTNILTSKNDPWGGVNNTNAPITVHGVTIPAGAEWGINKGEIERFLREQHISTAGETALAGKVAGVVVNNTEVEKDGNGKVNLTIPVVDQSLSAVSPNPVANNVISSELNSINSNMPVEAEVDASQESGGMVPLIFRNAQGDEVFSAQIPAAQEVGEVIAPKVTTALLTPAVTKLGDQIIMTWKYDCLRTADGASERVNYPAQTVNITVKVGMTTVHEEMHSLVAPSDTVHTLTLDASKITSAGTVNIQVQATTPIDEETKTSRSSKTVTVITMDLNTTFDPASQLALSNGYVNGQTVSIPYTYTVPTGTTLKVWVDGVLDSTTTISGTGRNYIYLQASNLSAGRHNVQLLAESGGLLSNAVMVDLLKAGSSVEYVGVKLIAAVAQLSDMPLPYAYGNTGLPLTVAQFTEIAFDLAAWNEDALTSQVVVAVDGVTTQTLAVGRTSQRFTQRFDTSGNHTMTITCGESVRTFGVAVTASGIAESETVGYRKKLTASGRSNSEANPADWGGITKFYGVDWRTNGWSKDSQNTDALLLTNGARAIIGLRPFVQDVEDGDYSIQGRGMTLEMEVMISQVMERGATVMSCLCDNDTSGYPMGLKITTEEAGLYFGGVEEITTAEDLVDENGDYIDYEGNPTEEPVKLKISRPHGVAMNIAVDRWVHLAFVVQPVTSGYGLAMLFINGVLSRANRYTGSLRQNVPADITFDSDKADIRVRGLRYYRSPLGADEVLSNWIIDRPTAAEIQNASDDNNVGDTNKTTDADGNIAISRDTLLARGRGVLTIIRSGDSGNGMADLFACVDKKENFKADLVRWEPPLDGNGNSIGEGFEARNVRVRIQGTSSVKYPYKNIRIYLTTQQGDVARVLKIGGVDVTASASGYPLRGAANSIPQAVICCKTDFVDSSLVLNTGGAHLFNSIMHQLGLDTPPQAYDARVRQSIDGLPCDIFCGKSEQGTLTYCGQFVLNNEKSKSTKIFGMDGVKDSGNNTVDFRKYENQGTEENPNMVLVGPDTKPIALEALNNASPMTLFQPAGSANSADLSAQLSQLFDEGFEFNCPEDAKWSTIGTGDYAAWGGAKDAIKRWMGWIYDCFCDTAGYKAGNMTPANPDFGTQQGWSDESKAKWVSNKFKTEIGNYFDRDHLLTYYLFTDYWASVDQRAKNILWRSWDGLKWYATYYDGDTAMSIRNDAFMVYLYNVTRDTYDNERTKFAFEGHSSWLWCLVLANFEDELKACAVNLRNMMSTQVMLDEFNGVMQGNWCPRQYNKSGKLKYIDTIENMNYVYTLTGNRELHRTQFITDRARLLDARYGAGNYNGDVVTFTVVRNQNDAYSSMKLTSGDLYYFGYKLNGLWLQGPTKVAAGDNLTLQFTGTLATNDPLMLGGASCLRELDMTNMGSQLNGTVGLSLCTMLAKLVMPATMGVSNAPLTLGNISKLEYVDITGQTAVHTGTAGLFDLSKHTRLKTLLAGGTALTTVKIAEGAPITTLVLPATLTTLTLRYLPKLEQSGLTLQGTSNITALNFAECPYLDWQAIMQQCSNITHVRIEGMTGRVRSGMLRPFMSGYRGLTADGTEQTYPALIGSVQLLDVVDDFDTMKSFFALCGLDLEECQYSEYVFDDLETDPANITNVDNKTGYDYRTGVTPTIDHPNGYYASGHVKLIHDHCVPVMAYVNPDTHKLHVEELSRQNYAKLADGSNADHTGASTVLERDGFLYVPHYWYKGVNDYKNARKYFLPSFKKTQPSSSATVTTRLALTQLTKIADKLPLNSRHSVGDAIDESLFFTTDSLDTYKVEVKGMKQVRFPGYLDKTDKLGCCLFTDDFDNIIQIFTFQMTDVKKNGVVVNPADFDNNIGDYVFLSIPAEATNLYFACTKLSAAKQPEVILTDSKEIEAIEPDWVEHLPELVGLWQGHAPGITTGGTPTGGLRSLSGKATSRGNGTSTNISWTYDANGNPTALPSIAINGTAMDFLNLARVRTALTGVLNGEYSAVGYETSKDLANLMMAWFGTRDIESIVGAGGTPSYTTGIRDSIGAADSDITLMSGASSSNTNQLNKMWGLEGWTGSLYEWVDKGCMNVPSFDAFIKSHRAQTGTGWVTDYLYRILQQNGQERSVKAEATNQATCVARVRFGRYCDIVVSSYTAETSYANCYAAYQSSNNGLGRVLGRSSFNAGAPAGVACSGTGNASAISYTHGGARLCFFGEIENEEDIK